VRDTVTIDQALEAFVEDQRQRLSARTMRGYDDVVELLRHSLNGYGPNALGQAEHRRWEKAFDSGDEEAFCHLFGPERIVGHLSEFLGYFMVRKVIAGQELLRSAGTVTKRLAEWHISDPSLGLFTQALAVAPWHAYALGGRLA